MPLVTERTFRVRHYECDAYGHVNHANYLRYMQETALDASAAAGYTVAGYESMGRIWLIRLTDITYRRPLTYGDSVVVKTWVVDFRRVRSRRAYELRLASNDEIVAEAMTDWVYLDSRNMRPVTIPEEMIKAFLPECPPATAPPRKPFPKSPPPPDDVFKITTRVEWHDVDGARHANNATYLTYLEKCSIQVIANYGWSMNRMREEGFGIIARQYQIEYLHPAYHTELLELATWFSDPRRATAIRHYTIHRVSDMTLLARARGLWVWVDLETGRPRRIPIDFLEDFAPNQAV